MRPAVSDRLDEEARAAILNPTASYYVGWDECGYVTNAACDSFYLDDDTVFRALRITARIDSMDDKQRERVLEILSRVEIERTRSAEVRDADSPELAAAHRSAAEGCFILSEALHGR
jgi:hypothetical protein